MRDTEDMYKFIHAIDNAPRISFSIRNIQFEGQAVPKHPRAVPSPEENSMENIGSWIYFFPIIGLLPCVEDLDFQHLNVLNLRLRYDCNLKVGSQTVSVTDG